MYKIIINIGTEIGGVYILDFSMMDEEFVELTVKRKKKEI